MGVCPATGPRPDGGVAVVVRKDEPHLRTGGSTLVKDDGPKTAGDHFKSLETIAEHFPGAISSQETLAKVAAVLEKRGFTRHNTLYAQSVCPDEINHEKGDITNIFTEYLGEVFHLGGLAGIPFTGKTGFSAYSHHVRTGGHLFILQAPHVGLSSNQNLGKYDRLGQEAPGAACGAAVGGLAHCCAGKKLPCLATSLDDWQMAFIINHIDPVKDEIAGMPTENEKQARLARETHKIGKTMLDEIVSMDFGGPDSKMLILSGIQINMPAPIPDYFLPITFELHSKDKPVESLYDETFPN